MSKIERRHQARQKQQQKHQEHARSTSIFTGQHAAPRIIALVPLTSDADPKAAIQSLNKSLDIETELPSDGPTTVRVDRFKQSLQYIPVQRDLFSALNACRVADFVAFILSSSEEVDEDGEMLLRAIEGQGVSNILTLVQGLDKIEPPKKRPQVLDSLKSYVTHFFPQEKIHSLDTRQQCANVMRSLCASTPRGVRWREERSYMLVNEVQWPADTEEKGTAILTGVVRGKGLKANRLLQVGDWGDFQIEKITAAPRPVSSKRKTEAMAVDEEGAVTTLEEPDANQDDLDELAPEDIMMDEGDDMTIAGAPSKRKGVLLDDHHYFEDDETHLPEQPKRLPKGTSKYQAAWFLGDMSDSGSDWEDEVEMKDARADTDGAALPQDGTKGLDRTSQGEPTEAAPSEFPQSEAFQDLSPNDEAEEIEAYRQNKRKEAEEDAEFPDEIELLPNVLARERLSRYRGLKSLRTSHWETEEDKAFEPEEWNRLLQVSNYRASHSQVTREALVGGVQPGTRVHVYLRDVPSALQNRASSSSLLTAFSLLRHEHKQTAMNFTITLSSDHQVPLKSKQELILQCGFRRLVINPLYSSTGNTPNNVHKFDRYLHQGQTAMISFIGPMIWGSVPALFFQRPTSTETSDSKPISSPLQLIATGTSQPPASNRVIAKRIILTGHPYKIHKKLVTIRWMFFNAEDIRWFQAVELFTKRGRSGFIQESLGTHGYFKARFDQKINPQDSVGMSLYKRMWPRRSKALTVDDVAALKEDAPELVDGEMQVD
ncbi:MAG: hypothetical protein MMC23_005961 [Stictis urceolatum]|nr:hypothetical protein [Stictis urceolata]